MSSLIISQWAAQWNVSSAAIRDLQIRLGGSDYVPVAPHDSDESEAAVQAKVRLEASRKRCRLWRNNLGVTDDHVRYGLANDSPTVNKHLKSSDLIGIRPVLIKQEHVGHIIGQFLSREIKSSHWYYTSTTRERAQLAWLELVVSMGGDACFANGEGTL